VILDSLIINILRIFLKESNLTEEELDYLRTNELFINLLAWYEMDRERWFTLSINQRKTLFANLRADINGILGGGRP